MSEDCMALKRALQAAELQNKRKGKLEPTSNTTCYLQLPSQPSKNQKPAQSSQLLSVKLERGEVESRMKPN